MSASNGGVYFVKVMASKTKIYIVMELVTGGELFDKIVSEQYLCQHLGGTFSHSCVYCVLNFSAFCGLGFAREAQGGRREEIFPATDQRC
jgi:hypothetical protein